MNAISVESATSVFEADLSTAEHASATLILLDAYASEPMGAGSPLSPAVRSALIPGLLAHPGTHVFLAFHGSTPVGIATCFRGFSTFAARPLLNISDYYVKPAMRGLGIGRSLLQLVEQRAIDLGCCKLTLEVQENNHQARRVYAMAGFAQAVHVPETGGALFLSKLLDEQVT